MSDYSTDGSTALSPSGPPKSDVTAGGTETAVLGGTVSSILPEPTNPDVLLAAAHHFVSSERLATELNVLAIVGLTGLESTPKTPDELRNYIKRHTGVRPQATVVGHSLRVLEGAGFAERGRGETWTVTPAGREQVEQSLQWAEASRAELERTVAVAGEEAGLPGAQARAAQLTDVLLKILEESLFTAVIAEKRGVEKVGHHLVPKSPDIPALVARAGELMPDDDDARQLIARLLRRAINPGDTFASVQVTDLVTAALIQLVVGHEDGVDLRQAVGSLAGVSVVVDTPIALLLLAEPEVVANTERVLRQAVECGIDLRFGPLLAREVSSCIRFAGGTTTRERIDDRFHLDELDLVLDVTDGNEILNSYVRGRWEGRYADWDAFEAEAAGIVERLRALGATQANFPGEDTADVVEFLRGHNETIVRRGIKEPGTPSAVADARLMAFLKRRRQQQPKGVWPAAWLLSPDTHVPETYRLVTKEPEPATLSLGQLGALLLRFADAGARVGLAKAATGSLRREAVFATSARLSPATLDRLVEIASSPDISLADRRKISRGVAGLLEQAEKETDVEKLIVEVTTQVLASSGSQIARRYEESIAREQAKTRAAEDRAAEEKRQREKTERKAETDAREKQESDQRSKDAERREREQKALRVRDLVLLAALFGVLTAAYILGHASVGGIGFAAIWQAWVLWGEQIREGQLRPSVPAITLGAVSAGLGVRDLF